MSYKDTINLPKTKFSMKGNLVQREPEFLKKWEKEDLYAQIRKARGALRNSFYTMGLPPYRRPPYRNRIKQNIKRHNCSVLYDEGV